MTCNDVCKITATLQHCNLAKVDKIKVKSQREGKGIFFLSLQFQMMTEKSCQVQNIWEQEWKMNIKLLRGARQSLLGMPPGEAIGAFGRAQCANFYSAAELYCRWEDMRNSNIPYHKLWISKTFDLKMLTRLIIWGLYIKNKYLSVFVSPASFWQTASPL